MIKCSECNSEIIEIPYVNEEGKKETLYAHSETSKKCSIKNDGVDIKITDRKLNNIFNDMIKQTIEEGKVDENSKDLPLLDTIGTQPPKPLNREETLKNRLTNGCVSLSEFDSIVERIKTKIDV